MSYKKISDHIEQGLLRIIEQHKEKPNFESLLRIILERYQQIEDDMGNFVSKRHLSEAIDKQLDELAKDLGLTRNGDTDLRLKTRCYAQIARYWSSGRIEQIISIVSLLSGAESIRIEEVFPAYIRCFIKTDIIVDRDIKDAVRFATAAGVGIEFMAVSPVVPFGFSNNPITLGFGTLAEPDVGGKFTINI